MILELIDEAIAAGARERARSSASARVHSRAGAPLTSATIVGTARRPVPRAA